MKYNKLGHTNIEVSQMCLGTMTWGEQNTEKEAFEQLDLQSKLVLTLLMLQKCIPFHHVRKHMD